METKIKINGTIHRQSNDYPTHTRCGENIKVMNGVAVTNVETTCLECFGQDLNS